VKKAVYSATVEPREGRETLAVAVLRNTHGLTRETHLSLEFFQSPEYENIASLGAKLEGLFRSRCASAARRAQPGSKQLWPRRWTGCWKKPNVVSRSSVTRVWAR